ncbi:flavin reductase family protein [Streptomyces sp. NPDC026589]|uniref:flavin reductase family protein n=1 Tax=Streptomyces sp. NPDC026589 TaxID=3155609 RepID=UPI00340216A7
MPQRTEVDPCAFRHALGHFATGIAAVTGTGPDDGAPTGFAVNSFCSVSLDPPLVAFCVARTSTTWPVLRAAGRVCVNFLAAGQMPVSRRLATRGEDKFTGLEWHPDTPGGLPVPTGTLAWLECSLEAEYPAGDHDIVLARVRHLATSSEPPEASDPLLFFRGAYGGFRAFEAVRRGVTSNGE